MTSRTVLRRCNPNGHGALSLVKYSDEEIGETVYVVTEPDNFDNEFYNLADAQECYSKAIDRWHDTPNWEAQAEYDDKWGDPLNIPNADY